MIMVIGGAYQGKYGFAQNELGVKDGWIDGEQCRYEEIFSCRAIQHFHDLVKRCMARGINLDHLAEELMERNPDIVIVTNEQGYGVVPIERFDRQYREYLGRICSSLAANSNAVYRIICGIGTVIKHD